MPLALVAGAAVLLLVVVMFGGSLAVVSSDNGSGGNGLCPAAPSATGTADIPPAHMALYEKAGRQYGIPWNVLAAIGDTESDHGRGRSPGIRSGTNHAGAAGPMQFLPGTWAAFGVDGNHDGRRNIYDPADAIPAAAAYLKHNGAPTHMERALFGYNHAGWYVTKVLRQAAAYGRKGASSACTGVTLAGTGRAAVAVRAALRWVGTPYSWGGGGLTGPTEGFGRGAGVVGFDCSGLTRYAWHQAGITLPRLAADQQRAAEPVPGGQQRPGDLAFFIGAGGSRTNPGHVGLLVGAGKMIEAPRTGLTVRVSVVGDRSDLIGYGRPTVR